MRKILLLLAASALLAAPAAMAGDGVVHFKQPLTKGFYRGKNVEYFDFGPLKLKPGNKTAPIWVFTNGGDGQRNIIDTVPGRKDYSPLWDVMMVTWSDGADARVLKSAAEVRKARAAGEVTIKRPGVVVNCPVV